VWALLGVSLVRDAKGEPLYFITQVQDITDRKTLEVQLEHRAFHDDLTGLPNRALFANRLKHAIARSGRDDGTVAVLFLDLDNFKVINESLGHESGDKLLVEVARRLRDCVRVEDTVARLGGDEFTILLEGVEGERDAVAGRIAGVLRVPLVIEDHEVSVSASIGIALDDGGRSSGEDLLRKADLAMYGAKNKGKARFDIFDASMNEAAHARLKMENDLRRALEREEFRLHYQPKVNLGSGETLGFEALLRWAHPERGMVEPSNFIPVAEETGLIVRIGGWALTEACRRVREWGETSPKGLTVSVNLSVRQFQRKELPRDVLQALEESGLPPENLILEITESVMMDDAPLTEGIVRELKDLGVRLAIDDFGTGYSSLAYLKRFPINYLKIDRSFVDGLGRDPESTAIVSATVGLSKNLGLNLVAEGIETADQLEKLKGLGCKVGQGFYSPGPCPGRQWRRCSRPPPGNGEPLPGVRRTGNHGTESRIPKG
jgi:diguanylate cyclase (GGDEF)-like protein